MQRTTPWIFVVLAGVALALAMPGPGFWLLVVIFPGLLLEAVEGESKRWRPWLLGFLAGTVHWVVATHWVHGVMHHYGGLPWIGAAGAVVGMGAILAVSWAVVLGLTALLTPVWRIWFLPVGWVAVDSLRRFQPIQFPWNDVAATVAHQPALLGSLPVWGASGIGWAIVALGAGLWGLARRDRRPSAAALLVAAVGCTITAAALAPGFEPSGKPIHVAVLQPGTTLEEKWDPMQWQEIADRVWTQTRRAADDGAELVLWPESAVPFRLDTDEAYQRIVTGLARDLDVEIVLNSTAGAGDGYTNAAYLVTPEGISSVRYDKVHLVPFGEYVPPWASLVAGEALVREVGSYTPGEKVDILPATVGLGVAVCYEVVFSSHSTAAVREGAEILISLTNDGWYGFSWAPEQHFAQVRLRAAEQRRWFARAALTGISGFVDGFGRVTESLGTGEQGGLVAAVTPSTALTPRNRWGDWWAVLCAVAAVLFFFGARARVSKRASAHPGP